ncbi:MAG: hypothetical protein L3J73_05285 [Thermoplasmata archaeon]|nr:hypothetical protein [Thermoplasmata archaeon]
MAGFWLRTGLALFLLGGAALVGAAEFGCSARTNSCVAWSVAGLAGALLVLVAWAFVLIRYRRLRPSVLSWSAELRHDPPAADDARLPDHPR